MYLKAQVLLAVTQQLEVKMLLLLLLLLLLLVLLLLFVHANLSVCAMNTLWSFYCDKNEHQFLHIYVLPIHHEFVLVLSCRAPFSMRNRGLR